MNFKLISGSVGSYEVGVACVMSAAVAEWRIRNGEPLGKATDELECVCPLIRTFLIGLNDSKFWLDNDHRTVTLTPYITKILGTNEPDLLAKRAMILTNWVVRDLAKNGPPGITDLGTARGVRRVANMNFHEAVKKGCTGLDLLRVIINITDYLIVVLDSDDVVKNSVTIADVKTATSNRETYAAVIGGYAIRVTEYADVKLDDILGILDRLISCKE